MIVVFQMQGRQLEITTGYLSRSAFTDKQKVSSGNGELYRIFLDAGVDLVRTCKITDRKIKYIFGGQKDEANVISARPVSLA